MVIVSKLKYFYQYYELILGSITWSSSSLVKTPSLLGLRDFKRDKRRDKAFTYLLLRVSSFYADEHEAIAILKHTVISK